MDPDQLIFFLVVSATITALIYAAMGKPVRGEAMSEPTEQGRANFESWISKPPFEYSTARFGNGEYVYATVGFAWKAWQEAQAKAELEAALLSVEKGHDELRRRVAELESGQARIKAEAVREAVAALDTLDISGLMPIQKLGFCICIEKLHEYANQIEGGE